MTHCFCLVSERNVVRNVNNFAIGGLQMTSSKHDYANYDQFAPNFDVAYKTIQRVFVPNLKLFGPMNTELWAKKLENFLLR